MATSISWTNETWNPLVGCSKISAGCQKCYAAEAAKSARLQQFPQYQKVGDWDGTIEFVENQLLKPLSWRSPKKVFVCSMSDIFHANVKDEWLDKIFAIMAIASQHTFQILTKRPERMQKYFDDDFRSNLINEAAYKIDKSRRISNIPLPNVWLGTSVENQKVADDRVPLLLTTPATVRFLSCEPLLENLNLVSQKREDGIYNYLLNTWEPRRIGAGGAVAGGRISPYSNEGINLVIIGGESGSGARPCHINWVRSIVKQCQQAKVPVFVKQLGAIPIESTPYIDGVAQNHFQLKLKDRKGGNIDEFPEDLRIREFPV